MTDNINGPVLSASLDELKYLVFEGMQGEQGVPGPQGPAGADGEDGDDGYSPTVSIVAITGGHKVVITDENGDHEFNVMDGTDGADGADGSDGAGIALLYYLPSYGTMQWYAHPGDESLTDITGAEISDLVLEDGRAVFAYEPGTQRIYQLARLPDNMGSTAWFVCWTQYEVDLLEMAWNSAAVTKSNVTPQRIPNHSGASGGSVLKVIESGGSKYLAWGSVPAELPSGGTAGQVLKKTASGVAWANESGGSGSGAFVIPVTGSTSDGFTTTATAEEIRAHKENLVATLNGMIYHFKGSMSSDPNSWYFFYFACEVPSGNPDRVDTVWIRVEVLATSVNVIVFDGDVFVVPQPTSQQNGKLLGVVGGEYAFVDDRLPAVTASDNGKFLRVVNGAWAAQTVPSAESNSFGGGS